VPKIIILTTKLSKWKLKTDFESKSHTQRSLVDSFAAKAAEFNLTEELIRASSTDWFWAKDGNSLRLSKSGNFYFKEVLELRYYHAKFTEPLTSNKILKLVRFCKGPYYIENYFNAMFYSTRDSTMLILSNNNFDLIRL
jgi:hypothetical protein